MPDEHLTEYEKERALRVAENQRQMESLGLVQLAAQVKGAASKPKPPKVPRVKRAASWDAGHTQPSRQSMRVAGVKAELPPDLQHLYGGEVCEAQPAEPTRRRARPRREPAEGNGEAGEEPGSSGAAGGYGYAKHARAMDASKLAKHKMAGQPWSAELDAKLAADFKAGATKKELAAQFGRSQFAIHCRLERHKEHPLEA